MDDSEVQPGGRGAEGEILIVASPTAAAYAAASTKTTAASTSANESSDDTAVTSLARAGGEDDDEDEYACGSSAGDESRKGSSASSSHSQAPSKANSIGVLSIPSSSSAPYHQAYSTGSSSPQSVPTDDDNLHTDLDPDSDTTSSIDILAVSEVFLPPPARQYLVLDPAPCKASPSPSPLIPAAPAAALERMSITDRMAIDADGDKRKDGGIMPNEEMPPIEIESMCFFLHVDSGGQDLKDAHLGVDAAACDNDNDELTAISARIGHDHEQSRRESWCLEARTATSPISSSGKEVDASIGTTNDGIDGDEEVHQDATREY